MVGVVQSEGYACVNHVFTIAYGTCNTEHYLFVRTIVCADCCSVFTAVVAIACGEGQFVVRIKVHRMQCCQSCCACANLVHTVAQLVNAHAVVRNIDIGFMQLAAVYCVHGGFAEIALSYVSNLLATGINAILGNRRPLLNCQTIIGNCCSASFKGVCSNTVCSNTVYIQILI